MKTKPAINYTNRDYSSIRDGLIDYVKRYYASTFKDFSEASFGAMMLDIVSYVGDLESFNLDYAANEAIFDSAIEFNNIVRHGRPFGFRFKGLSSSTGKCKFYVLVPAKSLGLGPDPLYMPILKKNSGMVSQGGSKFLLLDDVDFSRSQNRVVVAQTSATTGLPTFYAIEAEGSVISGEFGEEIITVGDFSRYKKIKLSETNISEVISVVDSEGNEYYEVENLSQNVVYKSVTNKGEDNDTVPEILKPFTVGRRFTVEQESDVTYLQFGYGSDTILNKEASLLDPKNVILQRHGKEYFSNTSFDPTNLIQSDKFGIGPSNTKLKVKYRSNKFGQTSAAVGTIDRLTNVDMTFKDLTSLNANTVNTIQNSLEVSNEEAIVGDVSLPDSRELKLRIEGIHAAQDRAVTETDYEMLIYSMPPRFGSVKRARVVKDFNSFKRNLNLYVISEDSNGKLATASRVLKENIKRWLMGFKMINDTIDILDARIVNLEISYEVIFNQFKSKHEVLIETIDRLKDYFQILPKIGEPFSIGNVVNVLNKSEGVVDVVKLSIKNKVGGNYSSVSYDIERNLSADGRYILADESVIFEIRHLDNDLKGLVR